MRSSMVRSVGRLPLGDGSEVVVKRFHPKGVGRVMLMNLRGPQWSREWGAAHALLEMGLDTPTPLAVGQRAAKGVVLAGAVITGAIADAYPLVEALSGEKGFCAGIPREDFVREMGRFVARLHAARIFHHDLHGDNILVLPRPGSPGWYLLDLHRLNWSRSPSLGERLWNLAQLLVSLAGRLTPIEEEEILREYLMSAQQAVSLSEGLARVRRQKEKITGRHERSRTRRCLVESSGFKVLRVDRMKVFSRREFPSGILQDLLQEARSVKEPYDPRALKLSPTSRLTSHQRLLDGNPYRLCVKEYPRRGFLHTLRSSLVQSKARRFWRGWWGLRVRGFGVPEGYLLWEARRLGLVVGCGVVTEAVEEAIGLDRFVATRFSLPSDREALAVKRRLMEQMASTLAELHRKGVLHRDLKANNILIQERQDGLRIVFLDLDAVRFKGRVSRRDVVLNLAQLDASLPEMVTFGDRSRFLLKYWGGGRDRQTLRAVVRDVQALSRARKGGPA